MSIWRRTAIGLGLIELLAALGFAAIMLQSSDPIGRGIGQGMVELLAIPVCLLVLPGLALVVANRFAPIGCALIVLALPVAFALWRGA